jgi:hypothetical protein
MNDDDIDTFYLVGIHKLAEQVGDGLAPQLLERASDMRSRRLATAEIIRLPGLHERPISRNQVLADGLRDGARRPDARILRFPLARWQRNAEGRS